MILITFKHPQTAKFLIRRVREHQALKHQLIFDHFPKLNPVKAEVDANPAGHAY